MGTTAFIGLGILAWILLTLLVCAFVARVIRLRNHQRPDSTEPGASAEVKSAHSVEAGDAYPSGSYTPDLNPSGEIGDGANVDGAGDADCFQAAAYPEFGEDAAHVGPDGAGGYR